jgi:adenosine deaminase
MNFRQLEKVELHRHLEGALRLSTLLELAPQVGIEVPKTVQAQTDKFLVKTPLKDLATVLNKFWMTQAVLASEEILTRITFEAVEDAYSEGIRILELRYAPSFIQKYHENLSYEQIHRSIVKGLHLAEKLPVATGLIAIVQRVLSLEIAERICDFALEHRESFIALDLADDEEAVPAKVFAPIFAKARHAGLPITIHAGESNSPNSAQNVIDAIEILGAARIGHGLQIIKEPTAIELVRRKKIPLEICVTSNWLTNAISDLKNHPIRELINSGVLVTINSDDPGIFGTDLTQDYQLLHDHYSFSSSDFQRANDIAAQASFISLVKKQKHWPRPIHKI